MAHEKLITGLREQTLRLMREHARLAAECRELTAERDALRIERRSLQQRLGRLDAELSRMRLSEGLGGDGNDREAARARVNRLMREVDRCIALLSREER